MAPHRISPLFRFPALARRTAMIAALAALLVAGGFSPRQPWAAESAKNRLIHEQSPYLQQHRENPVWWFAWGPEAFEAARRANLPIFLSIGYSSCHWCHVMNRESFSNPEVAELLNGKFVAVLVDREERPDVDLAYQQVLLTMTGQVGWPMTVLLTPDGNPFMGATFIPRAQLTRMLRQFDQIWREEPGRIQAVGRQVTQQLQRDQGVETGGQPLPDEGVLRAAFAALRTGFDPKYGGFGPGSKFLPPLRLSLLLRIHARTGDPAALAMVTATLDAMARGGIHDQLGGGFHRYATDRQWHIPHFEKMLSDNALLAVAYLEGFQVTRNPEYRQVARGILDYLLRDMAHPGGGFYTSQDADSDHTEGKFYAWTLLEVRRALTPREFQSFVTTYPITAAGNFNPWLKDVEQNAGIGVVEQGNILHLRQGRPLPGGDPLLASARAKLMALRARRPHPARDEKIITGWNGLAIAALAKGFQVLGEQRYLDAARQAANFLRANLRDREGNLLRHWREGQARQKGFLNDYAFFIRGLLELYQSDFDPAWAGAALALQAVQDRLLWDQQGGGYFFAEPSGASPLPPAKPFGEEALPSGNSVAVLNLLQLADLTLQGGFRAKVARVLAVAGPGRWAHPADFPHLLIALDYWSDRSKEVAVIGSPGHPATRQVVAYLHGAFLPNKVVAFSLPRPLEQAATAMLPILYGRPMLAGKTTTYVCENNICRLPTTDLATVKKLVRENRPYALAGEK